MKSFVASLFVPKVTNQSFRNGSTVSISTSNSKSKPLVRHRKLRWMATVIGAYSCLLSGNAVKLSETFFHKISFLHI